VSRATLIKKKKHSCIKVVYLYEWVEMHIRIQTTIPLLSKISSHIWIHGHIPFLGGTWSMAASYVWNDWFMSVTWLIHVYTTIDSYVWCVSFAKYRLFYSKISSLLWGSCAKETYNLKEPINRSHLVRVMCIIVCFIRTNMYYQNSHTYVSTICIHTKMYQQYVSSCVQGGEDSQDVLNCRLFSANEPLITGLFCRKWPIKSHSMRLRHPVSFTRINLCEVIRRILSTKASYVGHDSLICVTWLILILDINYSYVWRDSLICASWFVPTCDMTHLWVWLIHVCVANCSIVWNDFIFYVHRATWLIHTCDMTRSHE